MQTFTLTITVDDDITEDGFDIEHTLREEGNDSLALSRMAKIFDAWEPHRVTVRLDAVTDGLAILARQHEPDPQLPISAALLKHADPVRTPHCLAVCKFCRCIFAGEIDEFGRPKSGGVCTGLGARS